MASTDLRVLIPGSFGKVTGTNLASRNSFQATYIVRIYLIRLNWFTLKRWAHFQTGRGHKYGSAYYEGAAYQGASWGRRRCCIILWAILIFLIAAGLAVGLYFLITCKYKEYFGKIKKDSHRLNHLLPDLHVRTVLYKMRTLHQYCVSKARKERFKNSFIQLGLNYCQWISSFVGCVII